MTSTFFEGQAVTVTRFGVKYAGHVAAPGADSTRVSVRLGSQPWRRPLDFETWEVSPTN